MAGDPCSKAAAHRKAQAAYVNKNKQAQRDRVAKSAAKSSTKAGSPGSRSKTPGKTNQGKSTGGKVGRPRKAGC